MKSGPGPTTPESNADRRAAIRVVPAVEACNSRLLGCTFGLNQLLGTCPRQNVVGGRGSRACRPATLLDEIALLPARRDFSQRRQVRNRFAALREFLHTDRREDCHDGRVGALVRKLVGGAGGHPAAPGESGDRESDCSAYCAPKGRFRLRRNLHGFRLPVIGGKGIVSPWANSSWLDLGIFRGPRLFNFIQPAPLTNVSCSRPNPCQTASGARCSTFGRVRRDVRCTHARSTAA